MGTRMMKIDTTHSEVGFSVRHMMISKVRGRFSKYEGEIGFNSADFSRSTVNVAIDVESVDTGVADRDTHLRSPDFFDVKTHPRMTFVSTRVEGTPAAFKVHGTLTIRGVSKEVTLDAEATGQGKDPWGNERMAFTAKTSINRKDFGLTWNQALETGGVLVAEKVDIELDVQAVVAQPQASDGARAQA